MKLKDSVITRRAFLLTLAGGWASAFFASLAYPIVRFVVPPYKEPDEVRLLLADLGDLAGDLVKQFAWGSKPAFLVKRGDAWLAFLGVCTHLDCNVTWRDADRKFHCACHDGWFDENGVNIAGPPPTPLRRLSAAVEGAEVVIRKAVPAA
jgi:Rieske Fe-S protein